MQMSSSLCIMSLLLHAIFDSPSPLPSLSHTSFIFHHFCTVSRLTHPAKHTCLIFFLLVPRPMSHCSAAYFTCRHCTICHLPYGKISLLPTDIRAPWIFLVSSYSNYLTFRTDLVFYKLYLGSLLNIWEILFTK